MIYRFDTYELDTDLFELRDAGEPVDLEPQVFSLLALLVEHSGRMITKDELIEKIWDGRVVSESAISARVKKARKAISDSGSAQKFIRTVHGKGLRFVGELREESAPAVDGAAAAVKSERPRVAILPFANLSGDPEQDYFSDGISQDLITNLAKHRWLDVIARNLVIGVKDEKVHWQQMAKELGVSYIVAGSVRRAGKRIRATVSLVDANTERNLWSDRYDRDLEDVFAVQDEITAKIAARLEPEIGASERRKVSRSARRDLKAWDCYHLGVWHFFKFTAENNLEAQQLLQQSRELDPDFGEAHAWWAYAIVLGMVYWDTDPAPALLDEALAATQRALDIDDRNAVFYALKARVQLARGEYQSALMENSIAIDLNPSFAAAYCGLADSLAYEGNYDDAIGHFEHALELSPNDPQRWAFLTYGALAHIFKGDYDVAIEWTDKANEIPNCQFWAYSHKAVALAHLGEIARAKFAIVRVLKERPQFSREFARQKLFYIKDPAQLEVYLEGLKLAGVVESR